MQQLASSPALRVHRPLALRSSLGCAAPLSALGGAPERRRVAAPHLRCRCVKEGQPAEEGAPSFLVQISTCVTIVRVLRTCSVI